MSDNQHVTDKITNDTKSGTQHSAKPENTYTLALITRNGANAAPNDTETNAIYNAFKDENPTVTIIAGQEESRNAKASLGIKLKEKLGNGVAAFSRHFNTRTGVLGPGRVSQTILSNDTEMKGKGRRFQHSAKWYKTANKGGEYGAFTVADQVFVSAAVHLDSSSYSTRVTEAKTIIEGMDKYIYANADNDARKMRVARAITPVFFGGDLNCREIIQQDGSSKDARDDTTYQSMAHFNACGFNEISASPRIATYAGKNIHKKPTEARAPATARTDSTEARAPATARTDSTEAEAPATARTDSTEARAPATARTDSTEAEAPATAPATAHHPDSKRSLDTVGGKVDGFYCRGPVTVTKEKIIDTPETSDHKAVVAIVTVTALKTPEAIFNASKKDICQQLDGFIALTKDSKDSADLIRLKNNINDLQFDVTNNSDNDTYLDSVFQHYQYLEEQMWAARLSHAKVMDHTAKLMKPVRKLQRQAKKIENNPNWLQRIYYQICFGAMANTERKNKACALEKKSNTLKKIIHDKETQLFAASTQKLSNAINNFTSEATKLVAPSAIAASNDSVATQPAKVRSRSNTQTISTPESNFGSTQSFSDSSKDDASLLALHTSGLFTKPNTPTKQFISNEAMNEETVPNTLLAY